MIDQTEIEVVAKAIGDSNARDDEGEFGRLFDLLDYSGENKTWTVLREASSRAIAALDAHRSAYLPDEVREVVGWIRGQAKAMREYNPDYPDAAYELDKAADALTAEHAARVKAEADATLLAGLFGQCVDESLWTAGHVSDPNAIAIIREYAALAKAADAATS